MHSNSGIASAKSASSPPTMMERVALRAPLSPPDTGASITRMPFSLPCSYSCCASEGEEVVMSMASAPGLALSKMPPRSQNTSLTSLG